MPPPSKNTDAHLSLELIAPSSLSKIAAEQSHRALDLKALRRASCAMLVLRAA